MSCGLSMKGGVAMNDAFVHAKQTGWRPCFTPFCFNTPCQLAPILHLRCHFWLRTWTLLKVYDTRKLGGWALTANCLSQSVSAL